MAFSICWENFTVSLEGASRRGSQWNQIANKSHQQIQKAKHKTNPKNKSENKPKQPIITSSSLVGAMAKALLFLLLTTTTTAFTTTTASTTTKEGDIMEKLRQHLANTNKTAVGVKDVPFFSFPYIIGFG